jgi:DNA-binding MarR family transcriptional regulator
MRRHHSAEMPLPALILQLARDQSRLYERQFGVSSSRLLLLRELGQQGELSQAELVQRLGMEGTLVTRFVKQMEGAGLLTRRSDPRDNRFTLVTLTPKGDEIAHQMADFTHSLEVQLLAGLSQVVIATLRQSLAHIQQNYAHLTTDCAPLAE